MSNHGHGGIEETNLTKNTSMDISDFIRVIISSSSRSISLKNMLDSSDSYLEELGFAKKGGTFYRTKSVITLTEGRELDLADEILLCDCTLGDININLMLAAGAFDSANSRGYFFAIKKIDETDSDVMIIPDSNDLIDGNTSISLTGLDHPTITFFSDGSNWWTI